MLTIDKDVLVAVVQDITCIWHVNMKERLITLSMKGRTVVLQGTGHLEIAAVDDAQADAAMTAFLRLTGREDLVQPNYAGGDNWAERYIAYVEEIAKDLRELDRSKVLGLWQGVAIPGYRSGLQEGDVPSPLENAVWLHRDALYNGNGLFRKVTTALARVEPRTGLASVDPRVHLHLDRFEHNPGVDVVLALQEAALAFLHSPKGAAYCGSISHRFNWGDAIEMVPATYLQRFGLMHLETGADYVVAINLDQVLCPGEDHQVKEVMHGGLA
jgi:hypothetical protein